MVYLEGTIRNDKSSTLPAGNNSYVYPSVTASFVFSELLKDKLPWFSFGKLRAGWAKVGNDTDPYQVLSTYAQYTNVDSTTPGYRLPNTLNNADLKPESTTSFEVGLEAAFLNDRIGFDLTYYKTTTTDQIIPLSVSRTSGYIYKVINSGKIQNKGLEFAFHATPVKTRDFEWKTSLTLASNKNMLMKGGVKWMVDNVYDNWFSGRQCLVYAQYWSQRNYTEEDRYQIRESVNNNCFNYMYMGIANMDKVIELNTDEATAAKNSAYGANCNQIAAAKIMKVWMTDIITDTWGNVPYSDVAKLEKEGLLYCKYDDQKDIYVSSLRLGACGIHNLDVLFYVLLAFAISFASIMI